MLDTLFWLLNFPASHGYTMVFIAAFGGMGLGMLAFGTAHTSARRLQAIRVREGLASPAATGRMPLPQRMLRISAQSLFFVVLACGAVGLLSLIGFPVTSAYIHTNGVRTTATMTDGDWITFTAQDGTEYTLANDFFTPSVYPDARATVGWGGEPVIVRYLPGHPQAFVIDSGPSSS